MSADPEEAAQLFGIFLISCLGGNLLYPFIVTLDLCFLFFVGRHVLIQRFPIHRSEFQLMQPGDMLNGPFGSGILMSMTKDERIDLLFQLFQRQFMVIPHSKILFDSIIFSCWDIDWMVSAVTQTLRDQMSVTSVCFDPLPLLGKHCRRSKYDTFDPGLCELVIKAITEAACLVTAFNRILIIKTEFHFQRINEAKDFFIVWSDLYLSINSIFCSDCRFHCAKSIVCTMDIHADFEYSFH